MVKVNNKNRIAGITDKERQLVMAEGFADPVFFLKFFFPHLFPKEIPWFHRGLLAIATRKTDFLLKYGELDKIVRHFVWREDPNPQIACPETPIFELVKDETGNVVSINLTCQQNVAGMVPRGFSKTTLIGVGVACYEILYKVHRFFVFLSETGTSAEMQLTNVKRELEANKLIHEIFGQLQPPDKSGLKWTATHIETTTGVIAVSRGRLAQVRGLNVRGQRPDRIIIDDVEDLEAVKSPEQRDKTLEWLFQDVIPALPRGDDNAGIFMLGTLLHLEALLMKVMKDPQWTAIRFSAIDKDGDPLWKDKFPLESIAKMKASAKLQGKINGFNMEYMSMISSEEDSFFKREQFVYKPTTRAECIGVALALDPAISDDPSACDSSIAVVGMKANGRLSVLDFWSKVGATPREQIDKYFELQKFWQPTKCGVEANAFQAALIHIMREEMARKHQYFEIEKLTHYQKKSERIEGILQPRYAARYVEHCRVFPQYESQLLDYPNGKVDGPDVVSMAVALLDPYAMQASANEHDGRRPEDDEGDDLDEVFQDDWRSF